MPENWDMIQVMNKIFLRIRLLQYWLKVWERNSQDFVEKRRKTAKFRLSSNFRTYVSEISLRHCLVSLRNFSVAVKLRSKCPKFRCRAIFRKKFRWALRNVVVALRHFEHSFRSALRNFEMHFRNTAVGHNLLPIDPCFQPFHSQVQKVQPS